MCAGAPFSGMTVGAVVRLVKLMTIVLLLAACDLAWAEEVPLPRAKPLSSRVAYPPSLAPVPEVLPLHDAEAWPSDCALRLAEIARFAHQPSLNGPGQCGASDVVRLERIIMPNSTLVTVMPAATLRCPIAEAVAQWVRNDLGPAMAELDSPPAAEAADAEILALRAGAALAVVRKNASRAAQVQALSEGIAKPTIVGAVLNEF